MTITEEDRKRLRKAMAALRSARCTCDGKHERDPVLHHPTARHDPFDLRCPRAVAEYDRDQALLRMGVVL